MINWDEEKNRQILEERGVCFEDVLEAVENGRILADMKHPNAEKYNHQRILIVKIDEYVYIVPYVEKDEELFLKTMYPSRKFTKLFLS